VAQWKGARAAPDQDAEARRVVLKDLESLVAPVIMAALFIGVVITILRAQNPQRRAAAKAREQAAEDADPRIR
jgi:cbb3-type cytochrome oxidase subunit 3